jgi:hypothetical protein
MAFDFLDDEERKGLILGSLASGIVSSLIASKSGADPGAAAAVGMGHAFTSGIDTISKFKHQQIEEQKVQEQIEASRDHRAYMQKHLNLEELRADIQKEHYKSVREGREAREKRLEGEKTAAKEKESTSSQALKEFMQSATATDVMGGPSASGARETLARYSDKMTSAHLSQAHALVSDIQREEAKRTATAERAVEKTGERQWHEKQAEKQFERQKELLKTKEGTKEDKEGKKLVSLQSPDGKETRTMTKAETQPYLDEGWIEVSKKRQAPENPFSALFSKEEMEKISGVTSGKAGEPKPVSSGPRLSEMTVTYVSGGKKYAIPRDKEAAFLKAHPDAAQEVK